MRQHEGALEARLRGQHPAPGARWDGYASRESLPPGDTISRGCRQRQLRTRRKAFLFRRLDSLPETRGRSRLNERPPVALDSAGSIEVALLCPDARLAIELDRTECLSDTEAYRHDRHKDQLLQMNGYWVLRFLAEDVGKALDRVLGTIMSAMGRTRRRMDSDLP